MHGNSVRVWPTEWHDTKDMLAGTTNSIVIRKSDGVRFVE